MPGDELLMPRASPAPPGAQVGLTTAVPPAPTGPKSLFRPPPVSVDIVPLQNGNGAPQIGNAVLLAKAVTAATHSDGTRPPAIYPQGAPYEPRAVQRDPTRFGDQMGYRDRPARVPFQTHLEIYFRVGIISAIITTRIDQVVPFCRPRRNRFDTGYEWYRPDGKDLTAKDQAWAAYLSSALETGGFFSQPLTHDSFEVVNRKLSFDTLLYNQTCLEVVPGLDGLPSEWFHVPAPTVRLANQPTVGPVRDPYRTYTVQVIEGVPVAEFNAFQLGFECMNPAVDLRQGGYGASRTEIAEVNIENYEKAMAYNANVFNNGNMVKKLINLRGRMPPDQFQALLHYFWMVCSGTANSGVMPLINSDGAIDAVDLYPSNRDMEFSSWAEHHVKGICFPAGTLVMMADGSQKPIEQVRAGDWVFTHRGRVRRVRDRSECLFTGRLTTVKAAYMGEVPCTPEHPWWTIRGGQRNIPETRGAFQFGERAWKEAKSLRYCATRRAQDFLIFPDLIVAEEPWLFCIPRSAGNHVNHQEAVHEVDEELARWLGLWIGDGAAAEKGAVSFHFHREQDFLADFVREFAKARFGLDARETVTGNVRSVWMSSVELARALAQTFGRLQPDRAFPKAAFTAPRAVALQLLRGLFEADGSVSLVKKLGRANACRISSASHALLLSAQALVRRLCGLTSLRLARDAETNAFKGGPCWELIAGIEVGLPWAGLAAGPKGELLRARKLHDEEVSQHSYPIEGGRAVRMRRPAAAAAAGARLVYNIEVEEDHSYLVAGGVAVHNCADWSIDPSEIGYKYGQQGGRALFESSNRLKLMESKDKGLKPLLLFLARFWNTHVIAQLDAVAALLGAAPLRIRFGGLDAMTPKELMDIDTMRVRTSTFIDEIRKENNQKPFPDGLGQVILDGAWQQLWTMKQQQELQMAQQAAQAAAARIAVGEEDDTDRAALRKLLELQSGGGPSIAAGLGTSTGAEAAGERTPGRNATASEFGGTPGTSTAATAEDLGKSRARPAPVPQPMGGIRFEVTV